MLERESFDNSAPRLLFGALYESGYTIVSASGGVVAMFRRRNGSMILQ